MRIAQWTILAFGCAFTFQGWATPESLMLGAISGGGGKGVVCRDKDGHVTSAELLDLWEGRTLYNEQPQAVTGDLAKDVEAEIQRLRYLYPAGWDEDGFPVNNPDPDFVLSEIRSTAKMFLTDDPSIKRLRGVKLVLTDDSYEIVQPRDCNVEQIVNYLPSNTVYLDQDLFDALDNINKTALIVHEALYRHLRDNFFEVNSIRTRRSIAYVASGHVFEDSVFPSHPKQWITCTSFVNDSRPWTYMRLYPVKMADGGEGVALYPMFVEGSVPIGISERTFVFSTQSSDILTEISSGKCDGNGSRIYGLFSGPVEFDHEIEIDLSCENGKLSMKFIDTLPGTLEKSEIPLGCYQEPN